MGRRRCTPHRRVDHGHHLWVDVRALGHVYHAETNFTAAEVGWFFNATTLGTAVSVALSSRMGDIYGSRKVLIAVSIVALLGSLVVGLMSDFWPLVIGRFLIGFSAGLPLSWGIVRPRADATQTQRISVWLGTVCSLFTPIALVLAGLSATVGLSWRSVTWFIFGLFAVQLFFALASRPAPIQPRSTTKTTNNLDWAGAIGLGLWVTAILLGVNAGAENGWTSPIVLAYFAAAAVLFVAWLFQQRRATSPVMSFENMDLRQTASGYLAMMVIAFLGLSFFVALPNMMQNPSWGLGLDPLTSSYPLLMVFPGTLVAGQLVKSLMPRIGPKAFLPLAAVSSLVVTLGIAFAHDSYWLFFLWSFLYGALVMTIYVSGYMLVAASTRQDNTSSVFGVLAVIQYLSVAVATAIVFIVIAPGPDGFTPESSWTGLWVGLSVLLVAVAVVMRLLAPRELTDRHAVSALGDLTDGLETGVVPPAGSVPSGAVK
ncbi:MFS transporter [Arthrobacter nitrophenolicus]|uniref:MFS transporter n=1 Tax=Arthrobacter nitrophenolicus TaxID=683150 RepID=UPI00034B070F|nr:MFS transporter [Arthrobacter nitrophenolicus]